MCVSSALARREDFIDAMSIHVDDLEDIPLRKDLVAFLWKATESALKEASERAEAPRAFAWQGLG
jgi:hypothetical protein